MRPGQLKNIQFVTGDSRQLKIKEELDLLFLDAHTADSNAYDHVKAELSNLGVWVKVGGRIVIDDTWHTQFGEGTLKAIREFSRLHQVAYTDYPQGHGLAIIEMTHVLPRL